LKEILVDSFPLEDKLDGVQQRAFVSQPVKITKKWRA
jgi:hypothetical protein